MRKVIKTEKSLSTEEKIKDAARKVFTQKGYAATRTRDIAEEAGINLALLNYYFRSKEKLFQLIMAEKVKQLFGVVAPILNETSTSFEEKMKKMAESYIDMLTEHPDLPLFVLSEIRTQPKQFADMVHAKDLLLNSYWVKQLNEKRPDMNPLHFVLNIMGMIIFPFIGKPVFQMIQEDGGNEFKKMLEERKVLIPIWVKAMLETV